MQSVVRWQLERDKVVDAANFVYDMYSFNKFDEILCFKTQLFIGKRCSSAIYYYFVQISKTLTSS